MDSFLLKMPTGSFSLKMPCKNIWLIKECFPRNHILQKNCNRNTLKISYRTMPNMSSHIAKHNNKILHQNLQQNLQQNLSTKEMDERGIPHCNCRVKAECFMPNQCRHCNMVYRYEVKRSDDNSTESYTGSTVGFKERHKTHMRQVDDDSNGSTTLSTHIKSLKSNNVQHTINWTCVERAAPFNAIAGWCRLCTLERYHILFSPGEHHLTRDPNFFLTASFDPNKS